MDLLLDMKTHDLVFVNGECPVVTDPVERVMQRLKIKLLTFKGEWFHNTQYGVPYWQDILGHKVSKSRVDMIFQEAILEEYEVGGIVSFKSSLENRVYSLEAKVKIKTPNGTAVGTLSLGGIEV